MQFVVHKHMKIDSQLMRQQRSRLMPFGKGIIFRPLPSLKLDRIRATNHALQSSRVEAKRLKKESGKAKCMRCLRFMGLASCFHLQRTGSLTRMASSISDMVTSPFSRSLRVFCTISVARLRFCMARRSYT